MSVGGLASGLDTNNIVAQLTALEQAKVTRELQKKENAQNTLDKFKELETKLLSLQTKAKTLELPKDFNLFKSTSNYEEYATVSGGEGATAGQYELVVHQLATAQKVASNSFSAVNKSMVDLEIMAQNDEPITISLSTSLAAQKVDTKKFVDITINSSDTLKDIVNKINSAEGAGVKASIMSMSNGDNRIVLTAVDSGTNGFYLKEDEGTSLLSALGIVDYSKQKATSENALTVLDGGPATKDTTFDKLNTVLNKNTFDNGDKLGIYLPADNGSGSPGWIAFDLYDSAGKARTIGDVLKDVNVALEASGAKFTASLNNSGEIVLEGKLNDDQNFGNLWLSEVKIQMGTFSDTFFSEQIQTVTDDEGEVHKFSILVPDPSDPNYDPSKYITVKKDMGILSNRNLFNENNIITEGQNAFYTVDGMSICSQSNDDDKTINGTIFNLKKADPSKVIKVSLETDVSGIADKISEFVEEFNALLKFIDENAKATVIEDTDKTTGKKISKRVVGAFTGDAGISGLRENIRGMFANVIKEIANPRTVDSEPNPKYNGFFTSYSAASRVGIIINKDTGYYDVDKEKLTKALNADFEGVRKLFTSGGYSDTPGFSVGRFTKDSDVGVYSCDGTDWYLNGRKDSATGKWYSSASGDWSLDNNGKWVLKKGTGQLIEPVEGTWVENSIFTTKKGLSIEIPNQFSGEPQVTFVRGIAGQISNFIEKAKTGYYSEEAKRYFDGYLKESKDTYQKRVDEIQKRVDQLQRRVDNYNDRLVKQFASLEKSMSNLQAQSANMLSALSGINSK
jgi:flagellar capping protein FliD